ncbi:nuclear transport factor 2 family protein [Flavobacterium ardleyense]|uniref:Nuclear transport factor 2 family protein n=1 Tax=Flavobacterium ardleyense TaxID=2038737 RepID=A0ABW5Z5C3_9FLAO
MTNREKIEFLFKDDGMRNEQFLKELIHEDFKLEWDSSSGNSISDKSFILNLSDAINANYEISYFEISHIIEENNQIVVKYSHKVATIENPKEIMLITKAVAIWTFEEGKITNGYLISKPN